MPKRIQRKRTKGWRMPENTVYVGRPTKWGNRHRVGYCEICKEIHTQQQAVNKFESELTPEQIKEIREELENKNLACWCPLDQPCHADVLLRLANG